MDLKLNQKIYGFTLKSREALPEINGEAYTFVHDKSKALLLYLKNDDVNKAFSIAFKTPPANDTGVFHILEHSVLCGSKKFPVKEPFVNLLKSSMQTFLNAMTFPDKTLYPVATTNERDLINLADVYLDAVLHPLIYQKPTIFQQEGWHFECLNNTQGAHTNACTNPHTDPCTNPCSLTLNGVVYNEMKGALSDPNSALYSALQAQLFPDTSYRFEAGGTPAAIPHLTYEQFLEEHKHHYRLHNSYIVLYGDLSIDAMLAFLDEAYLSPASEEERARDIAYAKGVTHDNTCDVVAGAMHTTADDRKKQRVDGACEYMPRKLDLQAPVKALGVRKTMVFAPEHACMALGYVIGTANERRRIMATDILLDALAGSNEAPLRRAILDAGIAGDVQAYVADSLLQPFAVIHLRGLVQSAAPRFRPLVHDTLYALAEGELDHSLIEASLSRAEFVMREGDFGIAPGVVLSMAALSGWLYDNNNATLYLHYEQDFAFLRQEIAKGYFEELIRSVFLENSHMAEVELVPAEKDENNAEAKFLHEVCTQMTPGDFKRIEQDVLHLRRQQEKPDSPEALKTLPHLHLEDISTPPKEAPYIAVEGTPFACLYHRVATHGIVYVYRYFDIRRFSLEDLGYLGLLRLVLGKLDTATHTASKLDTLINATLGDLSFFIDVYEDAKDADGFCPQFVVGASALSKCAHHLGALPREIMLTTDFSDTDKIKDILQQCRIGMEEGFSSAGHSAAMMRVASYYSPAAVIREKTSGVDFYRFLRKTLNSFDANAHNIAERLSEIAHTLFVDNAQTISLAGTKEDLEKFWESGAMLGRTGSETQRLCTKVPTIRNEAFIVPTDVCFTALGFDRRANHIPYLGTWQLAARILSFDYLWNEVRVVGGAYGTGFQAARTGNTRFYSFRDPHLDETLKRFEGAVPWLAAFNPSQSEMEDYIISSVAGFDAPLTARALIRRQDSDWFSKCSVLERLRIRSEIINARADDVRALSPHIAAGLQTHATCVFGNKDIIKSTSHTFRVIDLLGERPD